MTSILILPLCDTWMLFGDLVSLLSNRPSRASHGLKLGPGDFSPRGPGDSCGGKGFCGEDGSCQCDVRLGIGFLLGPLLLLQIAGNSASGSQIGS